MTEQTQLYTLPGGAEQSRRLFDDQSNPELVEARNIAQASEEFRGDLREVRSTNPEDTFRLDEEEEPTSGPLWDQQAREVRLLEQRQHHARTTHQERLTGAIQEMSPAQNIADIADTTIALYNFRTMKAA
ncbi:MAG TPA: hypothetical protein VFG56_03010 [Candidatus Saccharimonadales bacterium]|nr:hypothetical protein [Candidatus Saccharimonadales bacterium]